MANLLLRELQQAVWGRALRVRTTGSQIDFFFSIIAHLLVLHLFPWAPHADRWAEPPPSSGSKNKWKRSHSPPCGLSFRVHPEFENRVF